MYNTTNSYLPVISKYSICPNFYKWEKCTMDSWTNFSKLIQQIHKELSAKVCIYKITKIVNLWKAREYKGNETSTTVRYTNRC